MHNTISKSCKITQRFCRADPFPTVQETTACECAVRQKCTHNSRCQQQHSTDPAVGLLVPGNTESQPNITANHQREGIKTSCQCKLMSNKQIKFVSNCVWTRKLVPATTNPAPLKLRPYGAIQICLVLLLN